MHTFIKITVGLLFGLIVQQSFAGPASDAFARKDYNEAYRQWSKTPDSLEAKFGIGRILLEGLGGPKDTDKGLASIRFAASSGYRPAMEYLANFYKKSGDHKSAISYLKRLQETSKSRQRQEDIVFMLETLTRKPHSKSKDFCEELKTLAELGGSTDITTTRDCALNGLPSTMSMAQAEGEIKRALTTTPSFNALERLLPVALKPESGGFDPESIFNALLLLDPSLSSDSTKSLTDLGAVSREVCISLPVSTLKQRLNQLSYCALVALKGDRQLAIASARAFASGELGRKSPTLALIYAKLAGSPPELNGLQLQILSESLPVNSMWKEHLDFLISNAQTLPAQEFAAALQFQIEAASIPVPGYSRDKYSLLLNVAVSRENIELEHLEKLLNARDRLPALSVFGALGGEPKELDHNYALLKNRFTGAQGTQYKLKKAKASGDIKSLLANVTELMAMNPTISQEERIKFLDDALELIALKQYGLEATSANALAKLFLSVNYGKTNEEVTKGYQAALAVMRKLEQSQVDDVRRSPEVSAELSKNIETIKSYLLNTPALFIQQSPIQKSPTPSLEPKLKNNLDTKLKDLEEKKLLCDKTRAPDICRDAGRLLTIAFLNETYQLKAQDRFTEALSYLNKAVWGGDLLAHRYIVDVLEGKLGPSETEKKQSTESLQYLLARRDIGGELRLQLKTINTNILERSIIELGTIFTRQSKFAAACAKVKSLVDGNHLDEYDKDLAIAGLNSITCKPPTAQ